MGGGKPPRVNVGVCVCADAPSQNTIKVKTTGTDFWAPAVPKASTAANLFMAAATGFLGQSRVEHQSVLSLLARIEPKEMKIECLNSQVTIIWE